MIDHYVVQPSHLRGARVLEVHGGDFDPWPDVWLVLDRPHPAIAGERTAVAADYVVLSPVPPGVFVDDAPPLET